MGLRCGGQTGECFYNWRGCGGRGWALFGGGVLDGGRERRVGWRGRTGLFSCLECGHHLSNATKHDPKEQSHTVSHTGNRKLHQQEVQRAIAISRVAVLCGVRQAETRDEITIRAESEKERERERERKIQNCLLRYSAPILLKVLEKLDDVIKRVPDKHTLCHPDPGPEIHYIIIYSKTLDLCSLLLLLFKLHLIAEISVP